MVGQFGCNVGVEYINRLCLEHNILPNGKKSNDYPDNNYVSSNFLESKDGKLSPRAIFIDNDEKIYDTLIQTPYSSVFDKGSAYCTDFKEASSFQDYIYDIDEYYIEEISNSIRKNIEKCDDIEGFQFFYSVSGGTGSGMGSQMLCALRDQYPAEMFSLLTLYPSTRLSTDIKTYHNTVFAMHRIIENSDIVLSLSNESLYDYSSLFSRIPHPTLSDLNKLIVNSYLDITSVNRFPSQNRLGFRKISMNMAPFPRLKFFCINYLPLQCSLDSLNDETPDDLFSIPRCLLDITHEHKNLASSVIVRGDIPHFSIEKSITKYAHEKEIQSPLLPNPFCFSHTKNAPAFSNSSITLISNSSTIRHNFDRFLTSINKYRNMYPSRLLKLENKMDQCEYMEAESNLSDLRDEYNYMETGDLN